MFTYIASTCEELAPVGLDDPLHVGEELRKGLILQLFAQLLLKLLVLCFKERVQLWTAQDIILC